MTIEKKACNFDTMRHIERVRNLLNGFVVDGDGASCDSIWDDSCPYCEESGCMGECIECNCCGKVNCNGSCEIYYDPFRVEYEP